MTKVSVIVPVYNVEKYLEKCLDSLVNQTLKDIEIIVVNDGTKDNSQEIIDKYAKKYPKKVKGFIKENGGQSSARNYGLEYAKGEYIGFVDSDDYVELDMFEKLYNKAKEDDFDISICNLNFVYEDTDDKKEFSINMNSDLTDKESLRKHMINIYPVVWNKIYKKSLFETSKLKFKEKVWFEDVEFLYKLVPYVKSVGVIDDYLYNYLQRQGSVTNTFDKRLYNYVENLNGIVDFYKEKDFYDYYKKELEYVYVRYLFATFLKRAAKYNDEEFYKAVDCAVENVSNTFPKFRKNKYFYKSLKGIYLLLFNKKIAKLSRKIIGGNKRKK